MLYSELILLNLSSYWERFDRVVENKTYMVLPSTQIALGLLLISVGIVVTFDTKIDLFKSKE